MASEEKVWSAMSSSIFVTNGFLMLRSMWIRPERISSDQWVFGFVVLQGVG